MKYTNEQLQGILNDTVKFNKKHRHYGRTVELAKKYNRWMTGEDQAEMIVRLRKNETKEQKEQRVEITNSRTKYASSLIWATFDEIERADNVIDNIYFPDSEDNDDAQEKLVDLHSRLDKFSDNKDLKAYLHEKTKYFNFYDPNAFLVVEMEREDRTELPWTYPVEIYSNQAVMYEYAKKELQYLIAKQKCRKIETDESGKNKKECDADLYYLYAADYAIKLQELGKSGEYQMPAEIRALPAEEQPQIVRIQKDGEDDITEYAFWDYQTESQINPAVQLGYTGDPKTNLQTYIGVLEPADELYKDLINVKSEYDLHRALHGFLQKYAYANPCEHVYEDDNGRNYACDGGQLRGLNRDCPNCKGRGLIMHATVQDVHLIKRPADKTEHIPLDQMVHYVEIPQEITDRYKEEIKELPGLISRAVFNSEPLEHSEVVTTGVHKRLLKESVYNVFTKFGGAYSRGYKHCVLSTAIHLGIEEGLIIDHEFPKDFHLDTVDELIEQRKAAVGANLPYVAVDHIDFLILRKQSQDNPEHIEIVRARQQFLPFREKTKEERIMLINSLPDGHYLKLLYIHFEQVFDLIQYGEDYKDQKFYRLNYDKQREIVREALESILGKTLDELNEPAPAPSLRSGITDDDPEPPEPDTNEGPGADVDDPPAPPIENE